jgi:hypothetical protein
LGEIVRNAAERVSSLSKKLIEEVALDMINMFMSDTIEYLAYSIALNCDEVQTALVERGLDPTPDNILAIVEEFADKVDVESALKSADENARKIIDNMLSIGIGVARRFAKKEWIEKFTYDNVLKQAEKRNITKLLEYLKRYPKLSSKIIDYIRNQIISGSQS